MSNNQFDEITVIRYGLYDEASKKTWSMVENIDQFLFESGLLTLNQLKTIISEINKITLKVTNVTEPCVAEIMPLLLILYPILAAASWVGICLSIMILGSYNFAMILSLVLLPGSVIVVCPLGMVIASHYDKLKCNTIARKVRDYIKTTLNPQFASKRVQWTIQDNLSISVVSTKNNDEGIVIVTSHKSYNEPFWIAIKMLSGETQQLKVYPFTRIDYMKSKITSVNTEDHKLIYHGQELDDNCTLFNYGIQKKSILYLAPKLVVNSLTTLKIRTLTGYIVKLHVSTDDSIYSLKSHIETKMGVDPSNQRLIFRCKELNDNCKLSNYSFVNNDAIYLLTDGPYKHVSFVELVGNLKADGFTMNDICQAVTSYKRKYGQNHLYYMHLILPIIGSRSQQEGQSEPGTMHQNSLNKLEEEFEEYDTANELKQNNECVITEQNISPFPVGGKINVSSIEEKQMDTTEEMKMLVMMQWISNDMMKISVHFCKYDSISKFTFHISNDLYELDDNIYKKLISSIKSNFNLPDSSQLRLYENINESKIYVDNVMDLMDSIAANENDSHTHAFSLFAETI